MPNSAAELCLCGESIDSCGYTGGQYRDKVYFYIGEAF
jgi:hypothetical protein